MEGAVKSSCVPSTVDNWEAGCGIACCISTWDHVVSLPFTSNNASPILALVVRLGFVYTGDVEEGVKGTLEVTGFEFISRG